MAEGEGFNKTFLVAAVVVVIVGLFFLYYNNATDKEKAFLNHLEAYAAKLKILEEKGYYYRGERVINDEVAMVEVTKNKDGYWVKEEWPLYAWELVNVNNTSYVCLTFHKRVCDEVRGYTAKIAEKLEGYLLNERLGERMLNTWKVFYSAKAMKVVDAKLGEKEAYFDIRFSYADLSVEKLRELGYSPDMPIAKLSNVTFQAYFKDDLLMDRNISFTEPYEHFERWLIENLSSPAALPNVTVNETEFYEELSSFASFIEEYDRLLNGELENSQIRSLAINYRKPEVCLTLEGKERALCIDAYLTFTKDWHACSLLSGEEKDECYFAAARGIKKKEICDEIEDVDKKAQCFTLFSTNETEGGSS